MKPRILAFVFLALCGTASAQDRKNCPDFAHEGIHLKLDCIEALFSEPWIHFTMASMPPGNGFALGGVLEQETHHVSPATQLPEKCTEESGEQRKNDPPSDNCADSPGKAANGRLSVTDGLIAAAISTNQSWYTTGSFSWLPPLPYVAEEKNGMVRQKLGPLVTNQVFGLQLYGTHRDLQGLSFYGEGSRSGKVQYSFKDTETFAGTVARLPVTTWMRAEGRLEYRQLNLSADKDPLSIQNNFSETTAPGLSSQPGFMHYNAAIDTDAQARLERPSPPETVVPDPKAPPVPLTKPLVNLRFRNRVDYDWYQDLNSGHYTFRQFVFTGDETIHLESVFEKPIDNKSSPGTFGFLRFICGGTGHAKAKPGSAIQDSFKAKDVCDLGQLEIKTRVVNSQTGAGRVVPFYYQPTLGGSDIDSRLTLRGYPDYRFRGNDMALVQVEYTKPIPRLDPLGFLAFYDGGRIAGPTQSFASGPFRQDGGLGATLRLRGSVVAQVYMAMGAGHGANLGYNFTKLF